MGIETNEFVGVPIHKDVSAFEEKIYGGITKRQLVCFSLAGVVGVVTWLICTQIIGIDFNSASYPVMILATPPALAAFVRPDDLPLERYLKLVYTNITSVQRLPYESKSDPLCKSFSGRRPRSLGEE